MTFKIDYFSHRELSYISVNLIFTLTKDEELFSWFERKTLEYVPAKVILDTALYDQDLEKATKGWLEEVCKTADGGETFVRTKGISDRMTPTNEVEGFIAGEEYLTYLPKFNKFQFHRSFYKCNIARGFIQDIEALKQGINETGTTDNCLLFYLLEAASRIL